MPAFGQLVVIDELGIRPLCPTPRSLIELVRKSAHGNRDGNPLRGEKVELVFPIQTSRGDPCVRRPVERDVVKDVVSCKAFGLTVKDACNERVTACVVVEYPSGQTDRRIRNPVQRLWAVPHLTWKGEGVGRRESQLSCTHLYIDRCMPLTFCFANMQISTSLDHTGLQNL
jgi:hypothetical protein